MEAGKKPIKVKAYPEADVWIKGVLPGEGRLKNTGAGGFEYSTSPEGPIVGNVGTGFNEQTRQEMHKDPESWVGRMARIKSQGQFPSGAHRAPVFIARHEDYPLKAASAPLTAVIKSRHAAGACA
jgi:ATP-dependent DNA ligase